MVPDRTDTGRLLARTRGHWGIEIGLHWAKDINLGEDASPIHAGQEPTVMALLRDAAVSVLHLDEVTRIVTRLRRHGQHPERAVTLIVDPLPTRP